MSSLDKNVTFDKLVDQEDSAEEKQDKKDSTEEKEEQKGEEPDKIKDSSERFVTDPSFERKESASNAENGISSTDYLKFLEKDFGKDVDKR